MNARLSSRLLPKLLLLALALAPAALAQGCMGTPTREILLPSKLKGAKVTADGEEATDWKDGIKCRVPYISGVQMLRVEVAGKAPLVQRTRIFVNDDTAERVGENVIVAKIDQKALSRTILAWPEDPIINIGHDFDPPAKGTEGVVLLSSQTETRVTIDGKPWSGKFANRKGLLHEDFRTKAAAIRLKPGKHALEFAKEGFRPWRCEVEVAPGEYQIVGVTLMTTGPQPPTEGWPDPAAPATKPKPAPAPEPGKA